MVIVMDMSSGERLDEFGPFEDEVQCANWLPPQPEAGLQLIEAARPRRPQIQPPADVEEFLRRMYLAQE